MSLTPHLRLLFEAIEALRDSDDPEDIAAIARYDAGIADLRKTLDGMKWGTDGKPYFGPV